MSKLKASNINFDDDYIVVETEKIEEPIEEAPIPVKNVKESPSEEELIINRAKEQANQLIQDAQEQAKLIKEKALKEIEEQKEESLQKAQDEAKEIVENANLEAKNLTDSTKKEQEDLLNSSKDEIEKEKQKQANEGYSEGYKDASEKIQEELQEKIDSFNNFCNTQLAIKNKIIKSASRDILDIILNIARKVLLKEIDSDTLQKIIKKTITLFEKKENINIILSEKYARLLYELQKKSLTSEIDFSFEDFNQYDGFSVIYNPKFDDDTIIVENIKERFDASISSQMDFIVREILDNTQNGRIDDIESYANETEENES